MLRFKILASTLPVILAGVFAGSELSSAGRPCIALAETSVQIAAGSRQPELNVSFTSDPANATVRVQLIDSANEADFAYVDDVDHAGTGGCETTATTRWVGIAEPPSAGGPVIYLSRDGGADYRIFVRSTRFTPREAAALIVGARGEPSRATATAAL